MGGSVEMRQKRVVIVDDHPMLREGTRVLLESTEDLDVVGTAGGGAEALRVVAEQRPDVLILDVRLPDINGVEVARQVRQLFPDVAVLVMTGYDDYGYWKALMGLGVKGYLRKSAAGEEILSAVRMVASGKQVLDLDRPAGSRDLSNVITERERTVIRLLADGRRNIDIASDLGLSVKTVEYYVANLFEKLGAKTRTEVVARARQLGILSDSASSQRP
jgi:DNA-binding NarL/FixJ family response regulator